MAGFVQKAGSSSPGGASAMSAQNVSSVTSPAFGSSTTAGHLLVATGCCFQNGTSTPLTFSDSKSNTWQIDVSQFDVGTSDSIGVISTTAIASGKAGSGHTITAQGSGSGSYIEADCFEWDTGSVITVVPLDQTASSGSLTSPTTATTGTTAQAAELVVVCLNCNPSGTDNDVPDSGIGSPPTINGSTTGVTALGLQDLTDTTIGYNAAYYEASAINTFEVSWTFTQGPDPGGPVGVGGASPLIATYKIIASGGGGATGSAAITEGADTVAGTGSVGVSGSAAITEGHDTVAGTGAVGVSGSAAIVEGADTVSGTGTAGASGSAAITEPSDTVSASGSVGVSGSAAITEAADTVSGTGSVGVSGSAAITEGADTVSGSGSATTGAVGSAAITEGADTVTASGSIGVSGSAAVAEGADIVAAAGTTSGDQLSPLGSNPGGAGGGNSAGWSGKFDFSAKQQDPVTIEEVSDSVFHVEPSPVPRQLPPDAVIILSDALSSRPAEVDQDDDDEALALLLAADDELRAFAVSRLAAFVAGGK